MVSFCLQHGSYPSSKILLFDHPSSLALMGLSDLTHPCPQRPRLHQSKAEISSQKRKRRLPEWLEVGTWLGKRLSC
ncbi:hypothetical protein HBH70_056030 [Parastagonospora nodorum]|nr:hypothetical protein HBH52_061800 [Parastagonospora nodorum]KAH4065756.1 hypothetical protein HBH50_160790 [Parastagonospora nodorum]KAH4092245.1 hypothetical protein HBH48_083850 [Parastagonospora nodorum]KAH4267547.1 hypothetical protein HBI03_066570 [Parastagonospora nodorum]KAH4273309.1 hypothetical protein HBI04_136390 [Parastagonospora nodorum]